MAKALIDWAAFAVGVSVIVAVALGMDMETGGTVAASHIHHQFPECSKACHG